MPRPKRPPTYVQKTAAEKRAQALAARIAGADYDTVAMQAGYASRGGAHRAVMQALRDIPKANAEQLRAIEAERLDMMHMAVWGRALRGDTSAIDEALKIMQTRARLFGLNIEAEGTPAVIIQKAYIGIPLEHFLMPGTDDPEPEPYTVDGTAKEVKGDGR